MRITNSMMTANTKANINVNKANEDKLNTMTASGQKITRPSDDPVVAIRAMRLNTSLTELDQYHGKNIPDADAWFTDTETALMQTDDILSSMREKLNQASSEENVTSNVKDILEELRQLKDQFYAIGNADSAGRTVFTGFRTGEMLTFTEQDKMEYDIHQEFTKDDVQKMTYVKGSVLVTNEGAPTDGTTPITGYKEESVEAVESYRIRLPYEDISGYTGKDNKIQVKLPGGTTQEIEVEVVSTTGMTPAQVDDIYAPAASVTKARLIKETGEVIFTKAQYDTIKTADSISMDYSKENWKKGDPRPEHYFMCRTPKDPLNPDPRTYSDTYPDGIEYNYNRTLGGEPTTDPAGTPNGFIEQELSFEIAYNQSITINTHASDVYSHDIGRDIDELIAITQKVSNSETKIANVEKALEGTTDATKVSELNTTLAALKKENTLLKDQMHKMYTSAITSFKGYSDDVNKQISNVGALTARLDMTKNRVRDQKDNVKKLADDNINADLSETALDFKSAQLALEAAQLAAGKIANQTLLNYI